MVGNDHKFLRALPGSPIFLPEEFPHRPSHILQHPQILCASLQRISLPTLCVEKVITLVSDGLGLFGRAAARALPHEVVAEFEQTIDILAPVIEGELLLLLYAQFGLFQEDDDEAVEGVDLVGGKVFLGDSDVLLAHPVAAPGEEALVG